MAMKEAYNLEDLGHNFFEVQIAHTIFINEN